MQHFQLGQWLRERYRNFLPTQYSEKDIYVRSTDVDRTLMSAEANLAGLFPPQGNQIWNENLAWQPIPIHTTSEKNDNILAMKMPCDKYDFLLNKLLKSEKFVDIQKMNHNLYAYISLYSGTTITNLESLEYVYNTLTIESIYNLTLPNWTYSVFPNKMKPWAEFSFAVSCYTKDLARLKTGPLFNDILNHFANSTHHKSRKFFMYSGHDTTIANILNTLDAFEYHSPPYAATILFELRTLNGSYFVNILYKNTTIPQKIILKQCPFYCPLEKFVKLLEPIRLSPDQWKTECEMKFLGIIPFVTLQNTVFISCTVLLFLLLGSICISIICTKIRSDTKQDYLRLPNEDI